MVHLLAVELVMDIAAPGMKQIGREDRILALVSCRHRMSGCSSSSKRSTMGTRARTELMFQDAILSLVTGVL